jgi:hypothetical protein
MVLTWDQQPQEVYAGIKIAHSMHDLLDNVRTLAW